MPRPKIRYCSISDPFILIIREDDSLGLFIGEPERGKIRRKDMSPMGEKVCGSYRAKFALYLHQPQTSKYIAGCFYADTSGVFQSKANASAEGPEKTVTTLQGAVTAGSKSQWLFLVRPQGVMEVNAHFEDNSRASFISHELPDLDATQAHADLLHQCSQHAGRRSRRFRRRTSLVSRTRPTPQTSRT